MTRNLKHPVCFFVTVDVYEQFHQVASNRDISVSQLLRQLVREFLISQGGRESDDLQKSLNNGANASNPSSAFQKSDEENFKKERK